ncbi:MAG TPA: response regulator transcription factor [Allosphingosinicella sp.]|uniref:response regulator transcription factor n=1 Tax=Allosphingosinicella sp. TaxID=2823234 RepID=UPI002ED8BCAF
MTRVLVAEDDPLTLSGIEALLSNSNYEIVASVGDGAAVLEELPKARPDLLILDVDMPKRSGIDVLRTLRGRGDRRPVVLLTGRIADGVAFDAMQAGLDGLVIKARAPSVLLTCLDAVCQGKRWIDHEILQKMMDLSLSGGAADPLQGLSTRERAVVGLLLQGLRNRDIASELNVTEGTVKVHLHNIYEKLGVGSRTELVILASKANETGA